MAFRLLEPKERKKFIFPEDWDTSAIDSMAGLRKPGRQPQKRHSDRLYGDIWLLEQIAEKIGLLKDILTVFNGNNELVDMVLTLAMYPYLSKSSFKRLPRWQRIVRAPCDEPLTASRITRLTQRISTMHRDELFRLRARRLGKDALCAVDSTSQSAYGRSLTDIRWRKNKDGRNLPQTNEVVVYSLTDHHLIYYRTFPGNMPDCHTFPLIVKKLDGRQLITAEPVGRALISKRIRDYGDFAGKPKSMTLDRDSELYCEQFKERYVVETARKTPRQADRLRINLFFDPETRARQIKEQDIEVTCQEERLTYLKSAEEPIDDPEIVKVQNRYFKLKIDNGRLTDFKLDEKKLERERLLHGFFSLLTLSLDDDAVSALKQYRLRDEQEKYFEQMKDQMGFATQDNWSEDGKTGRLFILFVGLILASHVRHIWRSSKLSTLFDSSLGVLDEMRCIRAIAEPGKQATMTPFVSDQLKICEAFGVEVPSGCRPSYESKRIHKRGRPRRSPLTEEGS